MLSKMDFPKRTLLLVFLPLGIYMEQYLKDLQLANRYAQMFMFNQNYASSSAQASISVLSLWMKVVLAVISSGRSKT